MKMNMIMRFAIFAAIALWLIAGASAQPANPQPTGFKIEETRVGPWDESVVVLDPVFSDFSGEVLNAALSQDGRHLAYVVRRGTKVCVVADGQSGTEYDEITWYSRSSAPTAST